MVSTILMSAYLSCLLSFSFVSHPVVYCVLLLTSAISVGGIVYVVVGFSWYLVVFYLVYIGGVYVLFIFVSIHSPNPTAMGGSGYVILVLALGAFFCVFSCQALPLPSLVESSSYLCSYFEGISYCLFCLVLMVGFVGVSMVVGGKGSFFR